MEAVKGVLYVAVTHQVMSCLATLGKEMAIASGGTTKCLARAKIRTASLCFNNKKKILGVI